MPSNGHRNEEQKQDIYKILGVHRNSTLDEIKRAYKRLALRWHPDKNPDAKEDAERKFKEINAAYDILSDENKKTIYDKYGMEGLRANASGRPTHSDNDFASMFTGRGDGGFARNFMFQTHNPMFDFAFRDPFEIFHEFFGSKSPFDLDSLFETSNIFDTSLTNGNRRRHRHGNQRIQTSDSDDHFEFVPNVNSRKYRNEHDRRRPNGHADMYNISALANPFMGIGGGFLGNLLGLSDNSFGGMFGGGFGGFHGSSSAHFQPTMKSSIQTEIRNGKIVTTTRKEQNGQVIETVEENGILRSKTIDGQPVSSLQNGSSHKVTVDNRAKRRRK